MGYEYSWCEETSEFKCGPCANRRTVRAKLFIDENSEECIKCGKNDHVCIQRPLNEGNLGREKRMITEPNFKILSIGQKRNLIVFDSEDRTKCYKYYWSASSNTFICMGCRTREYFVYARFKTTNGNSEEENEKIIILSDTNHVCPLLDYEPIAAVAAAFERSEEIHSGFEYRTFKNGPPKIFLFLDSDKKECYEYAAILHHSEYSDKFLCIGCNGSAVRPRIISKVYLCKNANGQHFLKVLESQHTCTPRKYEPEKYSKTIVKPPNFLFCDYKDEISTKLLIFHPEGQRKHCYMYAFQREFACVQCRKKKKFLSAQVFQDEKGKECVSYKFFDHICEPLDYEKISEDCRILKSSGLLKPKKFIKNGGYEFRKNDTRSENGYLLIFDSKDKQLCYKFRLNPRTRNYFCINCKEMGQQVTAKLCKNKKLEIEGDEHICKPEKYEPIKNIVESSNFKVFKSKNGTDQLAIFTSDDKKIGYRYGFVKDKKAFICYACREHRPAVYAKLRQRFNGKEYVELSQSKHICKPRILNFD
uniref:Uncharacterized protein n=1 Tax=Panagrolaimus davidi TaxID=227884 RepID=A0A914RA25_9BILA